MMKLDPLETREINYSQTRKNVAKWFDVEYSKYQRLASIPVISSVRLSLAPRSTTSANSVEDTTVKRANAKQVLEFVNAVLDTLDERSQKIIRSRHIQKLLSWQVEEIVNLSRSQLYAQDCKACAQFAQTMDLTAGTNLAAYKETSDNER